MCDRQMRDRGAVGAAVRLLFLAAFFLIILPLTADAAAGDKRTNGDLSMHLHHMHTLMNHSLIMVVQGSNLLTLSHMPTGPALDQMTRVHGTEMMAEGKGTLKEILAGSEMQMAHERGSWNDPLMGYTHQLGAELLAVVDDLEKLDHVAGSRQMQHTRMALNHALEMAAEGSNLVMLGQMKMAGDLDRRAVAHGRKMLAQARRLWNGVVAGEGLDTFNAAGGRAFVRHGEKVLTLLEKMAALEK